MHRKRSIFNSQFLRTPTIRELLLIVKQKNFELISTALNNQHNYTIAYWRSEFGASLELTDISSKVNSSDYLCLKVTGTIQLVWSNFNFSSAGIVFLTYSLFLLGLV
jgi:hypothetical protein